MNTKIPVNKSYLYTAMKIYNLSTIIISSKYLYAVYIGKKSSTTLAFSITSEDATSQHLTVLIRIKHVLEQTNKNSIVLIIKTTKAYN